MFVDRIPVSDLADTAFLAALDRLRLVAKRVAPRGSYAEQRSRDKGSGLEFRDYRPYSRGDDMRRIDWNVYRRLGRVFLRLFEELEDLPLYLLPDVSKSAYFIEQGPRGESLPPRARAGLRCALGLASIALGQHDKVGVFPFGDDLETAVRPAAGKGRILALAARFAEIRARGATDLSRSLATFEAQRLRDGLVCVISDFFDPRGLDAITESLARLRHRLLLVRLVRASDREPALTGDLRLVDCEGRAAAEVSITPDVLSRYRDAVARFDEGLASFAVSRGAGLVEIDVDRDVLPQLERLFATGTFAV